MLLWGSAMGESRAMKHRVPVQRSHVHLQVSALLPPMAIQPHCALGVVCPGEREDRLVRTVHGQVSLDDASPDNLASEVAQVADPQPPTEDLAVGEIHLGPALLIGNRLFV